MRYLRERCNREREREKERGRGRERTEWQSGSGGGIVVVADSVDSDGGGVVQGAVCNVQCIAMHHDTKPLGVFTELHRCVVAR